jgi:hypothetical protein
MHGKLLNSKQHSFTYDSHKYTHTHSSYTNSLAFTQPLTDSMIDVDDALELLTEDNEFRVPLLRSNSHMFTHSRPSGGRDSAIGGQGR